MKVARNTILAREQELRVSTRWLSEASGSRAQTLALLDRVLPWPALIAAVRPAYSADVRKARGGRPGHSLQMMLRAYVISQVWRMSYRVLAGSLSDSAAFAAFVGSPLARATPGATRLRAFVALLDKSHAEGEALPLRDTVDLLILTALRNAGLSYVRGTIDEPVFKSVRTAPQGEVAT